MKKKIEKFQQAIFFSKQYPYSSMMIFPDIIDCKSPKNVRLVGGSVVSQGKLWAILDSWVRHSEKSKKMTLLFSLFIILCMRNTAERVKKVVKNN